MWAIWGNVNGKQKLIASYWTNLKDDLEIELSLFDGKSEINWYCREADDLIRKNLTSDSVLTVQTFRKQGIDAISGNTLDKIEKNLGNFTTFKNNFLIMEWKVSPRNIGWHDSALQISDALKITMIPLSKYIAMHNTKRIVLSGQDPSHVYDKSDIEREISQALGPNITFILDTTKTITYDSFTGDFFIHELIDRLAQENNLEYVYGSEVIVMGDEAYLQVRKPSVIGFHTDYEQHIFEFKYPYQKNSSSNYITVVNGVIDEPMFPVGSKIVLNNRYMRIVHINSFLSRRRIPVTQFVSADSVPKRIYYRLIPSNAKPQLLERNYLQDYNIGLGKIMKYYGDDNDPTMRLAVNDQVSYGNSVRGIETAFFDQNVKGITMYNAVPYAGNEVGVLYPEEPEAVGVYNNVFNRKDIGVVVGKIYQNQQFPTRNSVNDYRLTLTNKAATDYYRYTSDSWIRASRKENIIGYKADLDHTDDLTSSDLDAQVKVYDGLGGGVRIYIDSSQKYIDITNNNAIRLNWNGKTIVIDNDKITLTGPVRIDGNAEIDGTLKVSGITTHGATLT